MRSGVNSVAGLNFKILPSYRIYSPIFRILAGNFFFYFLFHTHRLRVFLPGFMTNENFYHFGHISFF
jgi:hypothetical protein